ncbi:hypothetical protein QTP88_006920 [Uroleucon formosanum]
MNDNSKELSRNTTLIQDLDSKYKKQIVDIEKMSDDYISNIKNYSAEKMKETGASIQSKYAAAKELWDDKSKISKKNFGLVCRSSFVNLPNPRIVLIHYAYVSVGERISNFKNAILKVEKRARLNADIRETALEAKRYLDPKKGGSKKKIALPTARAVTNKSNKTKSVDNVAAGTSGFSGADMPIDPNEPTYCLCKQVSFGEMIACDNRDCATKWFHFECVSLITVPKGKWFCPNCRND